MGGGFRAAEESSGVAVYPLHDRAAPDRTGHGRGRCCRRCQTEPCSGDLRTDAGKARGGKPLGTAGAGSWFAVVHADQESVGPETGDGVVDRPETR